jgi:hypothetical protein
MRKRLMRKLGRNLVSVCGLATSGDLLIVAITIFVAIIPVRATADEIGDDRSINPRSYVQTIQAREGPDNREAEKEHSEFGERPDERQRFFLRKRSPDGVSPLPMEKYVKALEHVDQMPQYSTEAGQILPSRVELRRNIRGLGAVATAAGPALGTWSWLGPGNVGGRTRALVIHPTTPSIIYAAGVSGGIWKSTNGGASWVPLADLMADIAVCTLAIDPANPNVIYAGTGEGYFNGDSARGAGVFKTTDGGATWAQLAATNTPDFYYVNKVVVSPLASSRVYAATRTGIWRSTNSGATWAKVFATAAGAGGVTDLVIRSDQPTDVVLAADGNFTQATIYRNLDAGGAGTWTAVYSEPNMGRTSLVIAPSSPGTIYALASSLEAGTYSNGLLAVLRSMDGGATWTTRVRNTTSALSSCLLSGCDCTNTPYYGQGWYDNVIAVDPLDPNRVWAAGIVIFRSDDGAATWSLTGGGGDSGQYYIHTDNHVIVFHPQFNGTTNQQMYVGTDGGIYRTDNARGTGFLNFCDPPSGTVHWSSLNNGYGVTQFYHGLPYPGGATYFGGTQDNGTVWGTDSAGPNAWGPQPPPSLLTGDGGGDGGYVAVDPGNTNVLYVQSNSNFYKTTNGKDFTSATSGISESLSYVNPFAMDPSNTSTLWTGRNIPWRTTNGSTSWSQAGAAFNWDVTSIAVAPTDSNYVLFGLGNGQVARSHTALADNSASIWATVTLPASGYLSALTFDPINKNIAYATCSNFGSTHVWKSIDGGATFVSIDGAGATSIPDIPVNAIVVDPTNTSRLYVGTDLGVFTSIDGGGSWAVENSGFANVRTEALAITGSKLFAFTHGRGAYRVGLTSSLPPAAVTGVGANATTATSVMVSWSGSCATMCHVFRSADHVSYTQVGSSATSPFNDSSALANTAYLYKVRAVNGTIESTDSNTDIATTVMHSDDPLAANSTVIKAVQLTQIRTAVNAVRALAGLGVATFTDPSLVGVRIKAVHVTELRTDLDQGLSALGLATGGYTDLSLVGGFVRSTHFQEIRNRMK